VRDTVDGRAIAMYVRRSRAAEAEADSLVSQNARAARWLEEYFARPFPFQKLDFVLAPAFPFGGMEHPGAIFYSEERFVFRERPTTVQRIGRANTIYHEIAHQWFGDLVTMRWFDDLWLKEGFATYMAAKMQAALDPGSEAWKTFHLRNKPSAYEVDVTPGTTPVWQSLANLDQAKSNYGPIVYNKAPAILKQLEHLVGEDAFRRGIRDFLERHAYANATWRDLLDAIGDAAGRPLDAWGEQFILRPGAPLIEARLRTDRDSIVALDVAQRPADALSGDAPWPQRVDVLLGYGDGADVRISAELAATVTPVPGAAGRARPDFVFPNAGDHGYGVVLLDDGSMRWLERHIGEVDDALLRAMLWGAMWDLVREARLPPDRWIALAVRELPREGDEQIAAAVLPRLVRATRAYLDPARREATLPGVERMLRAVATDGARPYGIRKAHLDALVAVAGSRATLAWLDALLDSAAVAGEPLRAPTRWSIVTTLVGRGHSTAALRLAAETRRDTTSDGARRAFVAGAAWGDSVVKRAYFERWFADSTLNEDWATASLGAFNAIEQQSLTRRWLTPALDSLSWIQRHRRIFFLAAWLDAFLGGQSDAAAVRLVDDWLARHPTLAPDLRRKVLQYADELRRTARIRAAQAQTAQHGSARVPSGSP
jgi:aminopeptidase N